MFSDVTPEVGEEVRLDTQVTQKIASLRNLGSIINGNAKIDVDVTYCRCMLDEMEAHF